MPENEIKPEQTPVHVRSMGLKRVSMLVSALVLIGILTSFLLPALERAHEASRLESCADNLKQFGLVMKMYANDHRGVFPPLSRVPGKFMPDWESVYPEYLDDPYFDYPRIVACPSDVTAPMGADVTASRNQESSIWDDYSYIYFGYDITGEETEFAFLKAYEEKVTEAIRFANLAFNEHFGKWLLPESFWQENLYVDENRGTANGDILLRLDEGVPTFRNIDFSTVSWRPPTIVMFDRPGTTSTDFNHVPGGSNVIFIDGHVEFITYPSDEFVLSPTFIEKFLEMEARIEKLYADFVDAQGK
ncbi:MAG: DUF1559 domain-containing protein [Candidatus Hydrogenedentes bacterium]|nr:DUF1559 domain-containing protein [Candidatus Hydrogenedentota bacterium]